MYWSRGLSLTGTDESQLLQQYLQVLCWNNSGCCCLTGQAKDIVKTTLRSPQVKLCSPLIKLLLPPLVKIMFITDIACPR